MYIQVFDNFIQDNFPTNYERLSESRTADWQSKARV